MITAVKTFSALGKSTIEGIDTIAAKFQNIYITMKKKQYDILAHRNADFEVDFAEFMSQISNLEVYYSLNKLNTYHYNNRCNYNYGCHICT